MGKKKVAETAIVPISKYAIAKWDPEAIGEILADNAGTVGYTREDFNKATFPTGEVRQFAVPTAEGRGLVETIVGVIIDFRDIRAYWEKAYDGSGTPPDCSSEDTITGVGNPGGNCHSCPLSQFGSAAQGAGQACSQRRPLFVMQHNEILPLIVSLPPTSVRPCIKYFMRLSGNSQRFNSVITGIGLGTPVGKTYAQATLRRLELLEGQDVEHFRAITKAFRPILRKMRVADMVDEPANEDDVQATNPITNVDASETEEQAL